MSHDGDDEICVYATALRFHTVVDFNDKQNSFLNCMEAKLNKHKLARATCARERFEMESVTWTSCWCVFVNHHHIWGCLLLAIKICLCFFFGFELKRQRLWCNERKCVRVKLRSYGGFSRFSLNLRRQKISLYTKREENKLGIESLPTFLFVEPESCRLNKPWAKGIQKLIKTGLTTKNKLVFFLI